MTRPRGLAVLATSVALSCALVLGCAPAETFVAAPRAVQFSPAHTHVALELENRGTAPVKLSSFRVDPRDPDWGSFTIENQQNPRAVAPGQRVTLELRVHANNFLRRGHAGAPDRYHPAHASLLFSADGQPQRVALEFSQPSRLAASLRGLGLKLAALALVLLALFVSGPRSSRPTAGARARPTLLSRLAELRALLPFLALLAIAPLADSVCSAQLGAVLSEADALQCRDGRAGSMFALLGGQGTLLILLAALALALRPHIAHLDSSTQRGRQQGLMALLPALLAPACLHGSADLHALALVQAAPLPSFNALPAWHALTQPLAFALALLASAAITASPRARSALLITRGGLAAMITVLFLGGWTLPGLAPRGVVTPGRAGIALLCGALLGGALAWSHYRGDRDGRGARVLGVASALAIAPAIWLLTVRTGSWIPLTHAGSTALALLVTVSKVILIAWIIHGIASRLTSDARSFATTLFARALPWAGLLALLNLALTAALWRS